MPRLGIDRVSELDQNRLARARARYGRRKEAEGAVRNCRLHRLANHLRDKHPRAQPAAGLDRHPFELAILDMLGIAERARRRFQGYQRHAGHVPILGKRNHSSQGNRRWPA